MTDATRICAEQDCNQPTNRPNQPLCYDHYLELRDGTISLCSDCQVTYKPAEYPVCLSCYRRQRSIPEHGRGWDQVVSTQVDLPPDLVNAIKRVRKILVEHGPATRNHESSTTQLLVDPILRGLDWNFDDPYQVQRQYPVAGRRRGRRNSDRVDLALFKDGAPFAFIEVKRVDRDLEGEYILQLKRYASYLESGVGVLTNGRYWIIGNVTDSRLRLHFMVDILKESVSSASDKLSGVLGKTATAGTKQSAKLPTSEQITDALRNYRRREAHRLRRPAFTIFNDAIIALIAERKPANTAELQSIKGVGPTILRQYGEAILKIVAGRME